MSMEIAHGGDLRSLISTRHHENQDKGNNNVALDNNIAKFFMAEIVEACDYLHQMRIIHRDLKPEVKK